MYVLDTTKRRTDNLSRHTKPKRMLFSLEPQQIQACFCIEFSLSV
jgi:hypothetical protein